MQRIGPDLFFSPSDLNHFVECEHLTALDLLAVEGRGVAKEKDPQAEIIRAKGLEHEQPHLMNAIADDIARSSTATCTSPSPRTGTRIT